MMARKRLAFSGPAVADSPFTSAVAAVACLMLVSCCGCATQHCEVVLDGSNPELRIAADGVYFDGELIPPDEILDALEDAEIPKDRAIRIRLDSDMRDLRAPRLLMTLLARGGYTRSALVTEQHGDSNVKTVRLSADGFFVGARSVLPERIPAELERLEVPKDKLLQLVVDLDVRDPSPALELQRRLKRSGFRFVTVVRASAQDAFLLQVTAEGEVFYGMRPVGPDEVVRSLRRDDAMPGSPIRICAREEDEASENVLSTMGRLEDILRQAGFADVRRFWTKRTQPAEATPGLADRDVRRGGKGGIRYKKANE